MGQRRCQGPNPAGEPAACENLRKGGTRLHKTAMQHHDCRYISRKRPLLSTCSRTIIGRLPKAKNCLAAFGKHAYRFDHEFIYLKWEDVGIQSCCGPICALLTLVATLACVVPLQAGKKMFAFASVSACPVCDSFQLMLCTPVVGTSQPIDGLVSHGNNCRRC